MAGSFLSVDARSSAELKAVVLALSGAEKTIQADIRKSTKAMADPEWQKALKSHAVTPLEQLWLGNTGKTKVDNRGVTLQAGGRLKKVAGGFNTDPKAARIVEFGGDRSWKGSYQARSKKGKSFKVTRHTQRQLTARAPKGRVVYPAATPLVGRFVSLWVQTAVRVMWRAAEGKR